MLKRFLVKKIVLLFYCFSLNPLFAQQKQIDSLSVLLKNSKADTTKVSLLNAISKKFFDFQKYDTAKKYAEDALALAEKKDFTKGIESSYSNLGNIYHQLGNSFHGKGNYPEALKNYLEAVKMREKSGERSKLAKSYGNIGLIYWKQYNYAEALRNDTIALKIFEEIGDKTGMAGTYNNIGLVYELQHNYDEALKNYFKALKLYEETGDKQSMVNRYFNIGFLYDDLGKYDEALKNHFEALRISKEIGDSSGTAAAYDNIGDIYLHKAIKQTGANEKYSLLNEAMNSYSTASKIQEHLNEKQGLAISYTSMGDVYIEMKNFGKAKQFLMNSLSLSKELVMIDNIKSNYELLTKLDSATGDWKNAFMDHQSYILYRDSLLNQENTNKTMKIQMQYEFGKKEDSLKFQESLTSESLKKQKQTKNYLIAGLVLFAILSFFVYRNYQNRQKLKLQTLRNKIASDLHDDVGSTLSSISIFSQMAQEQSKETIPMLETIGESSRKMLDAMADIVWTIKTENDQFEKIILRMKSFAYELLGAKKIDFEFITDEEIEKMKLPMEVRKNLYLIFKEATNNMVKYSGADKAMFAIKEEKNNLMMTIHDNGKGFDIHRSSEGNGLKNMKKRAIEIGGELSIDSHPGNGTTIQLKVVT
jgi:signal transduction histidine kinase